MIEYAIETKNLTKKFKNEVAVNSMDMKVEKGKIYGLLGKNGAGKTTTMCMLLNLSAPTSGEIFLFGKPHNKNSNEIYSKVGSIIEVPGFYGNLSAFDNLKVFSKLSGNYDKHAIKEALKIVSLYDAKDKKFKNFSLGMKQRLGIALAIINNPEILILDEPINGLDPMGIIEIRNLLKRLAHEFGTTIIISSHILSEIEEIADVIGVINDGILLEETSKENLHKKLDKYVDFKVSDVNSAYKILSQSGLNEGIDFIVEGDDSIKLLTNLEYRYKINESFVKSGIKVEEINLCEESLEEYFTKLIEYGGV